MRANKDGKWSAARLRIFTEQLKFMWEQGKIKCPLHLPGGNERELLALFRKVEPDDYKFCTHRSIYHALLSGVEARSIINEARGDHTNSLCRGNSGTMCLISKNHNFYSSAIVGGVCAIAVGTAWAIKQSGKTGKHVWCFIGDGATDEGHFWEALRYSVGHRLPITFIIEDNNRATCTDDETRWGLATSKQLFLTQHDKVIYYSYEPTYPHVGSGKYVQF